MAMKLFVTFLLLIAGIELANAQTKGPDQLAYDYLQNERQRADKIVGDGAIPSLDSLAKAEKVLLDALVYYHRPDIVELSKTNKYLFARKGDISFDLALIQAKMGKTAEAATSLSYPLSGSSAPFYTKYIVDEPGFAAVRKDPVVAQQLAKAQAANRLFNSTALKTAYQPNISEDEKVAGLSKLWSEAKYNFAYFDHIPDVDWDKLYLDYLPKIRSTRSDGRVLPPTQRILCATARRAYGRMGERPGISRFRFSKTTHLGGSG